MATETQKAYSRDQVVRVYWADPYGATPGEMRISVQGTPIDKPVSAFDGDVDACASSCIDDALALG